MLDVREVVVALVVAVVLWIPLRLALGSVYGPGYLVIMFLAGLGALLYLEWRERREWP